MDIQTNPAASMTAPFAERYDNFIGGQWVPPNAGRYFENPTPVTGQPFCEIPRSDETDVEKALDAAHAAAPAWGKTAAAERALILNKIADRVEANLELIAIAETAGVDSSELASCITDGSYNDFVATTTQTVLESGVTGTPTVSVNGTVVANPSPDGLRTAIADAK